MQEQVSIDCVGAITVASTRDRAGHIEPLLFDRETSLPSGVFVAESGRLLVGREALDASAADPGRYVPMPARLLRASGPAGQADVVPADPIDLVAAVLGHVFERVSGQTGRSITDAVLVVPAGWGPQRRTQLRNAAYRAGFTTTTLVDAPAVLAEHHFTRSTVPTPVADGGCVLICRLFATSLDVVALRRNGERWEQLAAISADDVADLDGAAAVAALARAVTDALHAADLTTGDIAAVACHAPTAYAISINTSLRDLGITTPVRTIADHDAVDAALRHSPGQAAPAQHRWRLARHAATLAVAAPGAVALLWLLLQTGLYHAGLHSKLRDYERPAYMFTWWPAWALVATLALFAGLAAAQLGAERRLARPTPDSDSDLRRYLARGLRVAALVSLTTALVTAMLAKTNYPVVPIWYFLLWTAGPALIPAAACLLIAYLVRRGYLPATAWMVWLRVPNTAIALMTAGVITVEVHSYTTASLYSYKYYPGLPDAVGELGAIAIGLAMLPLLIRTVQYQIIASPLVIAIVMWTYSYLNTATDIAVLLVAITIWWLIRIRPAPAFSDPTHPVAVAAAEYETTHRR